MAISYFDYEFCWSCLKEYLEEFNSKFSYGFHIEPFLTGSEKIVGIFSDYGLFIFFELFENVVNPEVIECDQVNKIVININPNLVLEYKKFELILLKYSVRLLHYKTKKRGYKIDATRRIVK